MHDVIEPVESARERVDRHGERDLWIRRFALAVLAAVVVLALLNVFGQRATNTTVRTPLAQLTVHSPTRVRGGLLFQDRITITARAALPSAALVFNRGMFDGLTANTEEPAASAETSGPGGSVVFRIGSLAAGSTYVEYLEFQVNPTSVGARTQTVTVTSHGSAVATVSRTLTIFP
jgi:hypothetical protein